MHFDFMTYSNSYFQQHVSASNPAIFWLMFFETRIQMHLNLSLLLHNIKNIVSLEIFF